MWSRPASDTWLPSTVEALDDDLVVTLEDHERADRGQRTLEPLHRDMDHLANAALDQTVPGHVRHVGLDGRLLPLRDGALHVGVEVSE